MKYVSIVFDNDARVAFMHYVLLLLWLDDYDYDDDCWWLMAVGCCVAAWHGAYTGNNHNVEKKMNKKICGSLLQLAFYWKRFFSKFKNYMYEKYVQVSLNIW